VLLYCHPSFLFFLSSLQRILVGPLFFSCVLFCPPPPLAEVPPFFDELLPYLGFSAKGPQRVSSPPSLVFGFLVRSRPLFPPFFSSWESCHFVLFLFFPCLNGRWCRFCFFRAVFFSLLVFPPCFWSFKVNPPPPPPLVFSPGFAWRVSLQIKNTQALLPPSSRCRILNGLAFFPHDFRSRNFLSSPFFRPEFKRPLSPFIELERFFSFLLCSAVVSRLVERGCLLSPQWMSAPPFLLWNPPALPRFHAADPLWNRRYLPFSFYFLRLSPFFVELFSPFLLEIAGSARLCFVATRVLR